jgi:tetratricopeptide (TPR) repeat protein
MSDTENFMKEPTTPEETLALHNVLRSDPQRYLQIVNNWINKNPNNSLAYFDRHFAWMKIGKPQLALDDLNTVVQLDPDVSAFFSRGLVHRHLGQYEKALADFDRGEAIDPKQWEDDVFGLYYQADTHARLGNETEALAHCARLPGDFWTPGVHGAPRGRKSEIADELRRRAEEARRERPA